MRTVATKNRKRKKKYPWRIILDNGRQIPCHRNTILKVILLEGMAVVLSDFTWHCDSEASRKICSRFCGMPGRN